VAVAVLDGESGEEVREELKLDYESQLENLELKYARDYLMAAFYDKKVKKNKREIATQTEKGGFKKTLLDKLGGGRKNSSDNKSRL